MATPPSTGGGGSAPPVTSAATSAAAPKPLDLAGLGARLAGRVITAADSGYAVARRGFNPVFDGQRPLAVAQCASVADVQACVSAAAAARTPVAARSGGHSYAGYSSASGSLVVDVTRMAGVSVRPDGTAVVGAGARLGSVYSALAAAGRAVAAGSCPTVGIAGLTLGGGVGVLTRKYGLTCDQVESMRLVTADGVLRTVSASESPDLFWALRGGGGGNFGVVTDFTFRTVAAPQVAVVSVRFPAGSAAAVFGAWQQWLAGAPAELWTKLSLSSGSTPSVRLAGCYVGSGSAARGLVQDLVRRTGVAGTVRVTEKSYGEAMSYFAGSSAREAFRATSRILASPVDAGAVVDAASGPSGVDIMFDALGGAVRSGSSAFPYRSALATVQVYAAERSGAAAAVGRVRDRLGSVLGQRGYVNYIDPRMPDWGSAYYGANVGRLREIAQRVDPDRVFGFAQGVAAA